MDYFSIKILIDGQDIETTGLKEYLVSAEIHQEHSKCDMVIIGFWNEQLKFTDSNAFRERAEIDVFLGNGNTTNYIDRFILQKPEFRFSGTDIPVIRLIGFNESILLKDKGQKRRSFANMTDSEIAQQIATENALLTDLQTTSVRRTSETQLNETDLQVLSRLANRNGFVLYVEKKTLHFHPVRFDKSLTELEYGSGEKTLRQFNVSKTLVDKGGTFTATFLDKLTGVMQTVLSADVPDAIKTQDLSLYPDYRDAQQIFTQRHKRYEVSLDPEDNIQSQQQAINRIQQGNQYLIGGWGVATLTPALKARQIISLKGIGHLTGNYYLKKVIHKIEKGTAGGITRFYGLKSRFGILRQTSVPGSQGSSVTNNPAKDIQPNVIGEAAL